MIAVFGSGFGLYGHVAAIAELGRDVSVPVRYRPAFDGRGELRAYTSAIRFVDDETSLLSSADLAVLARRPADNEILARQAISVRWPRQLVIEKPLAKTPEAAIALHMDLQAAGVRHATPYLLAHCDWARECKRRLACGQTHEITLDWNFNSQLISPSWKTAPEEGGGPLAYYFIHLIALAEFLLGEYQVIECRSDDERPGRNLSMVARGGSAQLASTFCTTTEASTFSIAIDGMSLMRDATPFGIVPRRGQRDPRIDALKRFYMMEVFARPAAEESEDMGRRILASWAGLTQTCAARTGALRCAPKFPSPDA